MNTTRNYTTQYDNYIALTVIINGNHLGTMRVPDHLKTMYEIVTALAMTKAWKIDDQQISGDGMVWYIHTY